MIRRLLPSFAFLALIVISPGQDRWPNMPGYKEMQEGITRGQNIKISYLSGKWITETKYQFTDLDGVKEVDVLQGTVTLNNSLKPDVNALPRPQRQPDRGRQWDTVKSADGQMTAIYRDGNVYLNKGDIEINVTTEGDVAKKIKYGTGSWVYGEELNQTDAMGFSPDGKWLWYYRFDDSEVPLYYLAMGQKSQFTTLDIEAFPKPGSGNPKVDLYVYELETRKSKKIKVRDGDYDHGLGHYVYGISWLADSSELIYHRMDRQQKIREVCAVNPTSGDVRLVNREENQQAWVEFGPLEDLEASRVRQNPTYANDFLYLSEQDGFLNLWQLDVKKGTAQQITRHNGDVQSFIGRINNRLFYSVADGITPYHHQIYVSEKNGANPIRLSDPKYANSATVNSNGHYIAIVYQTFNEAPRLKIVDSNGKTVVEPKTNSYSNPTNDSRSVRWFSFPSLDGSVTLWGKVHLPSSYRLGQKLPVLFSVYGGPSGWRGTNMRYEKPNSLSESGFAIVEVFSRGGNGRGRDFRQALYRKLGIVEIDDMAAAAEALKKLDWADTQKVGIYGTSYGGYASAMALLRYPELFQAACSSSGVSDWRLYDSTYTERYMDLLENNVEGYNAGSCMTYAKNLKGWLMIYYGTSDNNVHPAHSYQLSDALSQAGKYHEMQAGADRGHTGIGLARMMEFFVERLIINPQK